MSEENQSYESTEADADKKRERRTTTEIISESIKVSNKRLEIEMRGEDIKEQKVKTLKDGLEDPSYATSTFTRDYFTKSINEDIALEEQSLGYAKEHADLTRQLYEEIGNMIHDEEEKIAYYQNQLKDDIASLEEYKNKIPKIKQSIKDDTKRMKNDKGILSESVIQKEKIAIESHKQLLKSSKECLKECPKAIKRDQDGIDRCVKHRQKLINWRNEIAEDIARDDNSVKMTEATIAHYKERLEGLKHEVFLEDQKYGRK